MSSSTSAAGEEVSEPTLGRNVVLSLAGQLAPAVAGLIAFPLLARRLSPDELGLLNIGWLVIGYFTLLDFGLGRAVTQGVATALARAEHTRVRELVWTSWMLVLAIGVPLAMLLASGSGWAARLVLDVSPALTGTSVAIITLLAATLPVFTLSTAARAVLEAYGRFDLVALVRVPVGTLSYAGPALLLPWTTSPLAMVVLLVAVRVAGLAGFLAACLVASPALRRPAVSRDAGRLLAAQGSWMTLATLAGSLHAYLDRVLVSALVPIAVFAYYATPQEVIWRFIVLPVAFSGALYPLFSAEWVGPRTRVSATYAGAVFAVIVSLGTVALWGANFSAEIMTAWLGPEVGSHTRTVTQWFLAGILLNGLATIPFAFLQAVGRARTTGLIQAAQLVPYVVALYVITRRFGIEGAAMVWTARMAIDAALLFTAARRTMHDAWNRDRPGSDDAAARGRRIRRRRCGRERRWCAAQ